MAELSAAAIVLAWEVGERRGPLDRALAMLWAAGEEGDLAALPISERDRRLLALRGATFGDGLACVATCPDCGETMEFELSASGLAGALVVPEPEAIALGHIQIEQRPLNSRDLAAAAEIPEAEVPAFLRGRACPGGDALPAELLPEIDARIEAREEASELSLTLTCAACGAAWQEVLDVADHIWLEIENAAWRVMGTVAEIASVFGWPEREILEMSEPRRRAYLRIARGA